jgi:hypothetical protein
MSLDVIYINNIINKTYTINVKYVSNFLLGFLLVIASYNTNTILPPSNAGIGNKFIIPMLIDNIATKNKNACGPALNAFLTILNIPTTEDILFNPIVRAPLLGAIKTFNVLTTKLKYDPHSASAFDKHPLKSI